MHTMDVKRQRTNRRAPVASVAGSVFRIVLACGVAWAASGISGEATAEDESKPAARTHPLAPALKIAQASYEKVVSAEDYEATFNKREVVGRRVSAHSMHIKLRHEPFSVYLRFLKPNAGREVIYAEGKYDGRLMVHETGLKSIVGTVSLLPTSPEALAESRYPITRIGIANMTKGVINQWKAETKYGECDVKYYPNAKLGQVECKVIESSHPRPRRQFKFHMTRLYIDKKTEFPIRVEQYGFPSRPGTSPPLLEEYTYSNIKVDVGLTDRHFDVRNPNYGF